MKRNRTTRSTPSSLLQSRNTIIPPAHGRKRLYRFASRPASARPSWVVLSSPLLSCSAHPAAPHPGPPANQRRVSAQDAIEAMISHQSTIMRSDYQQHANTTKAFLVEPSSSTTYLPFACDVRRQIYIYSNTIWIFDTKCTRYPAVLL